VIHVGRVVTSVLIESLSTADKKMRCDALVDTETSPMVLPAPWKERLGELEEIRTVELETATQSTIQESVCGPVRLRIEGFPAIFTGVVFIEMEPEHGEYESSIGYIVLEQSQAAVDMLGHRLVHVKRLDLK
jgi:hypothetical protein